MANRKAAESFIIKYISKLTPGSDNSSRYEDLFKTMSDVDFSKFMSGLETGEVFLTIIEPNFQETYTVENNLKLAEELDHNFFEKLWIEGNENTPTYLTPNEYLVIDLPVKRVSQILSKKISIPDHNKVIDSLTGQPTGDSKAAKVSYTELQVAAAMELEETMVELIKYRGGDRNGRAAYEASLSSTGKANLKTLSKFSSGVESTNTLKTFLTSAHLKNTL